MKFLSLGSALRTNGIVLFAKVAGGLAVRQVAAGAANRLRDKNVGRHFAAAALEIAEDAAFVRMFDAAGEEPAGLHHLMAGVVDGGGRVITAADERILVGVFGHLRKDFADLHSRHVGVDGLERPANLIGRLGLRIPGVDLTGAADQEEHDGVDIVVFDRAGRLLSKKAGQRQAERG